MGYIHSSSPIIIPSGSAYCPSKSGFVHPVHSVDFGAQAGARIKEIVANNRIFLNFIHFVFTKVAETAVWNQPLSVTDQSVSEESNPEYQLPWYEPGHTAELFP